MLDINLQLFAEDDDFILMDEEPTTPPEVEETQTEVEDTTETEEPEIQQRFKVKFNHEEKELGFDEAVPLIQKGMNYDKLQQRYDAIQNDPRLSKYDKVTQVSKLLGYQTDDQLLDALYQTYYQTTAQQQGLTPQQIQKEHQLQQKEQALTAKEKAEAQQREKNAAYERFLSIYPDVKPQDIKPETWAKVKAGMDLTAAFVEQRNQDLETQLRVLKQKEKNKSQAPVNGVTTHGATNTQGKDPFEMGFDSV